MKKSRIVQLVLAVLFGPLGLFYSSTPAALAFTLAAIALGAFTMGLGALLVWPVAVLVGFLTVGRHNAKVRLEERRHQELIQSTRGDKP